MARALASFFQNATRCSWLFRIGAHNKQRSVVIKSSEIPILCAQQKQTDDGKRDPDDSLPGWRFAKKQNPSHSHDCRATGQNGRNGRERTAFLEEYKEYDCSGAYADTSEHGINNSVWTRFLIPAVR